LLARLSVFAGGATLSAIERVGGDGRESGLAVLPRLARLIDASLVQRLDSSGTEPRYRLLETVRQYAGERLLEQGEQDAIRGRHAALFRDVAEEGRRRLRGPEQAVWLDRLERDHENMRAALAWALEREDAELIGRLAAGLWAFWYRRGYVREGRAALDAALALPTTSGLAGVRVQMLQGNTLLAQYHGDYSAARRYAEQGERIARDQGDARSLGEMLSAVGFVCRVQEDWDAARKAFGESLAVAREVGNVFGEAAALHHLGLLALESAHDNATAWSLNQQSLGLFRRLGDRRMECTVLHALARVARARNDVETARSLVAEASIACQEIGDDGVMVYVLYERAAVAAATGRLEQAVRLTAAAEKMTELLGMYVHPVYGHPGDSARLLAAARRALGDQRFASAWRRGQAATLEETIAQALADTVED
jgi:tetratricopeptide (TPR) repeat protein